MRNRLTNGLKERYLMILFGIMFFIVYFYPFWMTGVTHNDELMVLSSRENGFFCALNNLIQNELGQGRVMRIMAPFNQMIGFLTSNMVINRIIQSIIIAVSVVLVFYLFFKVFENKGIAMLGGMCALAFLPYSFESSIPQAYVGLTILPLIELILSCLSYVGYINTNKRKYMISTLVLYAIALLGYEYMITYIFVFPMIYCIRKGMKNNYKNVFIQMVQFGFVGIFYFICFFLSKILLPGDYEGTAISFVSLKSSWDIIEQIIKSSFPGYFVKSGKYAWLFQYYSQESMWAYLKKVITFQSLPEMRTILLVIIFIIIYLLFIHKRTEKELSVQTYIMSILFLVVYLIIPVTPNAISKMYQGNVGENGFVSLPITYFVYFAVLFIIMLTLWLIKQYRYVKWIYSLVLVGMLMLSVPIQIANEVFMQESKDDFDRYLVMEDVLKTEFIRQYDGQTIGAADFYKTKNTLAVRDDYWTQYAQEKCSLNIEFVNAYSNYTINVFYPDDAYICISDGKTLSVLSAKRLEGSHMIQTAENSYAIYQFEDYDMDDGLYCYSFIR